MRAHLPTIINELSKVEEHMVSIDLSGFTRESHKSPAFALPAKHYDNIFTNVQNYLVPAKHSTYKIVWDKVLEKLPLECSILDIGCGPGQFATICVEAGHNYVGADFSQVAVNRGRKIVPEATFHLVDITEDKSLLTKGNYDAITFIEFFEHIEEDLDVLSSVPEGKKIVLTVPKFWGKGHVRNFRTPSDVSMRYGRFIDVESLDTIAFGKLARRILLPSRARRSTPEQWTIYVLSGMRRDK